MRTTVDAITHKTTATKDPPTIEDTLIAFSLSMPAEELSYGYSGSDTGSDGVSGSATGSDGVSGSATGSDGVSGSATGSDGVSGSVGGSTIGGDYSTTVAGGVWTGTSSVAFSASYYSSYVVTWAAGAVYWAAWAAYACYVYYSRL